MDFEEKYLKYKIKYLELKNIIGGAAPVENIIIIFKLFDKDVKILYEKKINYEDMKKQNKIDIDFPKEYKLSSISIEGTNDKNIYTEVEKLFLELLKEQSKNLKVLFRLLDSSDKIIHEKEYSYEEIISGKPIDFKLKDKEYKSSQYNTINCFDSGTHDEIMKLFKKRLDDYLISTSRLVLRILNEGKTIETIEYNYNDLKDNKVKIDMNKLLKNGYGVTIYGPTEEIKNELNSIYEQTNKEVDILRKK